MPSVTPASNDKDAIPNSILSDTEPKPTHVKTIQWSSCTFLPPADAYRNNHHLKRLVWLQFSLLVRQEVASNRIIPTPMIHSYPVWSLLPRFPWPPPPLDSSSSWPPRWSPRRPPQSGSSYTTGSPTACGGGRRGVPCPALGGRRRAPPSSTRPSPTTTAPFAAAPSPPPPTSPSPTATRPSDSAPWDCTSSLSCFALLDLKNWYWVFEGWIF